MTVTFFSVMLVCLLGITVVLQIHKGYRRGLVKALVHLALFVASVLLSLLLTPVFSRSLAETFVDFFDDYVIYQRIVAGFPAFEVLFDPLAQMVAGVLLFLPILFVLYQLSKFILSVIQKGYRSVHPTNITNEYTAEDDPDFLKKTHVAGAWVGVVSGILLTIVLMAPIAGVITASDRLLRLGDTYNVDLSAIQNEKNDINYYANDVGVNVVRFCGGDLIFNSVASAQLPEQRIALNWELEAIEAFDATALQKNLSRMDALTPKHIGELRTQLEAVEDSFLLRAMTAQTLSLASDSWLKGGDFFGAERPSFGNSRLIDPMITKILEACRKTTSETVVEDLSVLLDFLQWGIEMKADMESGDYLQLMDKFSSGSFDQYFLHDGKGALTSALIRNEIEALTVRALVMETEDLSKYSEHAYDTLMEDIANSLNDIHLSSETSKNANLNALLKKNFKTLGVTLPTAVSSSLTDVLLDRFLDEAYVDKEMVSEYFKEIIFSNTSNE